jgi:hypothetical protein
MFIIYRIKFPRLNQKRKDRYNRTAEGEDEKERNGNHISGCSREIT